jgi:hypothetical protein
MKRDDAMSMREIRPFERAASTNGMKAGLAHGAAPLPGSQ